MSLALVKPRRCKASKAFSRSKLLSVNRVIQPSEIYWGGKSRKNTLKHCQVSVLPAPKGEARRFDVMQHPVTGDVSFCGLSHCKSAWACPDCRPERLADERRKIDAAYRAHLEAGGAWLFMTLTVMHFRHNSLIILGEKIRDAERKFWNSPGVRRLLEAAGKVGHIKNWEYTWGEESGWHPHTHQMLAVSPGVDPVALGDALFPYWAKACKNARLPAPTRARGLDIKHCFERDGKRGAVSYITKMGLSGAAREQAGGDDKTGKEDRFVPFDLLALIAQDGPGSWAVKPWLEYCAATKGKQIFAGLGDLLNLYSIDVDALGDGDRVELVWVGSAGQDLLTMMVVHGLECEFKLMIKAGESFQVACAWVRQFDLDRKMALFDRVA